MELTMTPSNVNTIMVDDKLLVIDNLTVPEGQEERYINQFAELFPMKISSSCMMVVVKGTVTFNVGFHEYTAPAGTSAIISAGTIIERLEIDSNAKLIFLCFPQQNLTSVAKIRQRHAQQVVLVHLQPVHVELLMNAYHTLRVILTDSAFCVDKDDAAHNCINLMGSIIEQGVNSQPEISAKASRKEQIVNRFLQSVHENYRQHRDVGFYADQLRLSLKYMSHVVYEQTGRHPSQWIKDYVILDAKTMLRSGRYTVQQVAAELHFPNQSFFGKYFKEAVGISPKKWK